MSTARLTLAEGDQVDVLLEKTEDGSGHVVLSKEKAERLKIWDAVEAAYESGEPVMGRVLDRIKGGLKVDIGLPAFLPGSLVDSRPVRHLESLIGQSFNMKVIKVNKRRGNIVLSRKAILDVENAEKKKQTLEHLEEGKILRGVVKNLTEYGAFIDLGGIDGLLHITDISWGRINHPSEKFQIGDELDVVSCSSSIARKSASRSASSSSRTIPGITRRAKYPPHGTHPRQGGQPHRLRRIRRGRGRHRGTDPRLRNVLDQAHQTPVEAAQHRRLGRVRRARYRPRSASPLAWPQADRAQPVGHDRLQVPRRRQAQR